jgi:hypothetical protein
VVPRAVARPATRREVRPGARQEDVAAPLNAKSIPQLTFRGHRAVDAAGSLN